MPLPPSFLKLARFGLVGGVVTLVFMGLNWLLAPRVGVQPAYFISYPPAVALHFCLNKWWTFADRRQVRARQLSEYLVLIVSAFLIQTGVFLLLTHFTSLPSWLASGLATVLQMGLSFVLLQRRVFSAPAAEG